MHFAGSNKTTNYYTTTSTTTAAAVATHYKEYSCYYCRVWLLISAYTACFVTRRHCWQCHEITCVFDNIDLL